MAAPSCSICRRADFLTTAACNTTRRVLSVALADVAEVGHATAAFGLAGVSQRLEDR